MRLPQLFLDALYPRRITCDLCGKDVRLEEDGPAAYLCLECLKLMEPSPDILIAPPLDGARAGLLYNDEAARLMHRFKYRQVRYLADTFAAFMNPLEESADYLLPVPLFEKRERRRGYNQSAILAKCVSERACIPMNQSLMIRTRDTLSQTALDHNERAKNVRGAFNVIGDVEGLSIVLVDDVFTTGATMGECARVLKDKGAGRVYALTACYAVG